MQRTSRIFIVGHNDSVENSLRQYFTSQRYTHVASNTNDGIDVLNPQKVDAFFKKFKPDYVFLGSVRSGGIAANQKFPAEFLYENMQAQDHVMHAAYQHKVRKLLYFSSTCAYPKDAKQPIKEESLLTGTLEETSESYAIAKIAGIRLAQAYRKQYGFNAIAAMPATLYGPGSDANIETAHVMGALIAKFHKAISERQKEVIVWGTGKPRREFLYVDDFAKACVFLMDHYESPELINVGCGYDVTIKELAGIIKDISGFKGKITFDTTKPDGAMRKLMHNGRLKKLGFTPAVDLKDGIAKTWKDYIKKGMK